MKARLEKILLGLILAPLAPLAGFLGFWWLSYATLPEKWIPFVTISGFLLGAVADIFILKRLISRAYQMKVVLWAVIYLFYAVGVFGFFMGVPVLEAMLAVPAGFVIGGRLAAEKAGPDRVRRVTGYTTWFTSGILFLACAASAVFALVSPSTPNDLQGMLGLGFEVTPLMIWSLILIGGMGLLAVNWGLTVASVRLTHRLLAMP